MTNTFESDSRHAKGVDKREIDIELDENLGLKNTAYARLKFNSAVQAMNSQSTKSTPSTTTSMNATTKGGF